MDEYTCCFETEMDEAEMIAPGWIVDPNDPEGSSRPYFHEYRPGYDYEKSH